MTLTHRHTLPDRELLGSGPKCPGLACPAYVEWLKAAPASESPWIYENKINAEGKYVHPLTDEELTDELDILAAMEHALVYLPHGKTRVNWTKLITPRRTYLQIPEYFGFTEEEVRLHSKVVGESFVSIDQVRDIFACDRKTATRFILERKIPVYKLFGRFRMFSGDILRAIESCRIDTDNVVWKRYLQHEAYKNDRASIYRVNAAARKAGTAGPGKAPKVRPTRGHPSRRRWSGKGVRGKLRQGGPGDGGSGPRSEPEAYAAIPDTERDSDGYSGPGLPEEG